MHKEYITDIMTRRPVLQTQRLILRFLKPEDWKDLYSYARLPEVSQYLLWDPHHTASYTRRYLRDLQKLYELGEYFEWGIEEKESGTLIGTCGFTDFDFYNMVGELGYSFSPSVWGKGYATEAAMEVVHFGFEVLHLKEIRAIYAPENHASKRVLEHLHMTYMGELPHMTIKGIEHKVGLYTIYKDQMQSL